MNQGNDKEKKLFVVEDNPPAIVSYIPIPMMSSLDRQFNKIKKIKKIWVRHFYQNANLDVKSWIKGDDIVLQALKAPKIDHTITQVEDKNATKDFIKDLVQANNASFKVEGTGETGLVTISNDGIQYTNYNIPDYESNEDALSVAEKVYQVYEDEINSGNIPKIKAKNDDVKINRIFNNEKTER
jgi:hypothetical protein